MIRKKKRLYRLYFKNPLTKNNIKGVAMMLIIFYDVIKRNYYHDKFESVRSNLKKTWSIINEVLLRKYTAVNKLTMFMYKGIALIEPQEIADKINELF